MRARISWLVVATTSTVVLCFVIPLCLLVRTMAEDRAMDAVDQEARNAAIVVARFADHRRLRDWLSTLDRPGSPTTVVLTADNRVLGGSQALRHDPDIRRARSGEAFSVIDSAGGRIYIPVVAGAGTAVIRSSVGVDQLHQGVAQAWLGIIGLGTALILLSVLIAAQLGRRISAPVRHVAEVAHQLREGDLSARAQVTGTPETEELARALNGLAEKTGDLLATERAAVGDLSHRLRTPVTALRLDAESVADPALATRLHTHITALQRTIDAVVREARRPVRSALLVSCDAVAITSDRVAFWSALAEDQQRPITSAISPGRQPVPVAAEELTDLIDIVIDNVFAHTPDGTAFSVALDRVGRSVRLIVADSGPGLSATGADEGTVGRSGLGLDIARRTATGCGGTFQVTEVMPTGTRVEVTFPVREP